MKQNERCFSSECTHCSPARLNTASVFEKWKIIITQSPYHIGVHCWLNWSSFKINITFNWTAEFIISCCAIKLQKAFIISLFSFWWKMKSRSLRFQIICLSSFHLYFKGLSHVLFQTDFRPFYSSWCETPDSCYI